MEQQRYYKNTYAQISWYKFDYGFTLITLIAWGVFVAGGVFALYGAIHQLFYFGIGDISDTIIRIIAVLMFSLFLFVLGTTFYTYLFHAVEVNFRGTGIEAKGMMGLSWKMELSEIAHIRGEAKFYFWRLVLASHDGKKKIYVTPAVADMGEMVERILLETPNCESIELGKFPKTYRAWNKEPDWALIEEAKKRAEENRKYKRTTTDNNGGNT